MADLAMRTLGPTSWISRLSSLVILLALASDAWANPCMPHPTKLAAWIIVVGASLFLEIFVTTGFLFFSGIAVVPMWLALVVVNAISYLGILLPLYETTKLVWLAEVAILAVETLLIKGLSHIGLFQGDTFDGLKWRYAFLSVLAGNACSYYVGTLLASADI